MFYFDDLMFYDRFSMLETSRTNEKKAVQRKKKKKKTLAMKPSSTKSLKRQSQ